MQLYTVEIRRDKLDVELTLYPSFILTMFENVDGWWLKKFGFYKNVKIRQEEDRVLIQVLDDYNVDIVINEFLGLWYDPEKYVQDVKSQYRQFIEKLIECTLNIRIAISRRDMLHIFTSVFLSRNTDYFTNVMRWVHKLCEITGDDLTKVDMNVILQVGRSYQLQQLPEAIRQFVNLQVDKIEDFWTIRRLLLSIKFVGPKVADAFLIFTGLSTWLAPSDIHFRRFVQKFKLFSNFIQPDKKYCSKYTCETCPKGSTCLTGLAYRTFGPLSAWIQTVSYVIDRKYCSDEKCVICPLYMKICNG